MEIFLLLALVAGVGSAGADCPGDGQGQGERSAWSASDYVSPATPEGRAEFDTSRRFYFDARKKMTAADFDAWLASIGARVVTEEEAIAQPGTAVAGAVSDVGAPQPSAVVTGEAEASVTAADTSITRGSAASTPDPISPASAKPLRVGR